MNIIDAIKSGKPFRRKCDASEEDSWLHVCLDEKAGCDEIMYVKSRENWLGGPACITADDWEIEAEKRELTWAQIYNASVESEKEEKDARFGYHYLLKRKLGFTE